MKKQCWIFVLFSAALFSFAQQPELEKFRGPYFGCRPPGLTPVIFAPGLISTEKRELNSVFTPDGKEFYYAIQTPGRGYKIFFSKESENGWSHPRPISFSSENSDVDMCITRDGRIMYFGSTRPVNGVKQNDFKIWYVEREGEGWSEAEYLDSPVNSGARALYPTVSDSGTLFFQAIREDSFGSRDIYFSKLVNGIYSDPIVYKNFLFALTTNLSRYSSISTH